MTNVQQWLYTNLQRWTPFSVLILLAGCACIFVIVWDIIHNLAIQPSIIGLLSLILGASGTATLFQHGVVVANGVAASTAQAVVQAQNTAPLNKIMSDNTAATQANTRAMEDGAPPPTPNPPTQKG